MITATLPMAADKSSGKTRRVGLEISQTKQPATTVHRAPMRINVEAYYNEADGTLEVCYDGEASGEVFLYRDNSLIGYDSEINTSFQILESGNYKIEIVAECWIACGYIQI